MDLLLKVTREILTGCFGSAAVIVAQNTWATAYGQEQPRRWFLLGNVEAAIGFWLPVAGLTCWTYARPICRVARTAHVDTLAVTLCPVESEVVVER